MCGKKKYIHIIIVVCAIFSTSIAFAEDSAATIRASLATISTDTDYATAKLAFDQIVNPSIDVAAIIAEIDRMAVAAQIMAGPSATSTQKTAAVRKVIYESGLWNDNRPYQYDHSDPLGRNIQNKLISTYIRTRRGNCVSMPYLFIILAERLGVEITTATAPLHIFVKYADESGQFINLETTSGAYPARDAWYRQQMPMTDEAVENGVYLKTLTKRETIAHMAAVVVDHHIIKGEYREAIRVADVILEFFPNDVYIMVKAGTAYGHLLRTRFYEKYPTPAEIPLNLWPEYEMLTEHNFKLFEKAEALGWRPVE